MNGGSDISDKEREQSERNFIRRFHDSEAKPARYLFDLVKSLSLSASCNFLFHFRFDELLNVHGHVSPFAQVSLRPPKVADVWVQFGEQRWNEKNLRLSMTMKELKGKKIIIIFFFSFPKISNENIFIIIFRKTQFCHWFISFKDARMALRSNLPGNYAFPIQEVVQLQCQGWG